MLKIQQNIQPGTVLRIRDAGMRKGNFYGDHFVTVNVELPKNLTAEQKNLLLELKNSIKGDNNGQENK